MLVKVKRQNLYLEQNTAAKWEILVTRVLARTGILIFITEPYGANRTDEIQGWLRRQWELGVPGFFYAAKPNTPQANHTRGCAFDINNWRKAEQVIREEAEKLGLVRDPSEGWHWNNPDGLANLARPGSVTTPGLDLAGLDMEEIEMPLDKKDLVAILTSEFEIAQNGKVRKVRLMDALGAVYFYGDHLNARIDNLETRVATIDEDTALRVWEHPIVRADRGADGRAIVSPASAMIGTMQVWVDEIKASQAKSAVTLDPSIDEAGLVAALKAGGFDPDDIAVVVADELDRRDREALDARTTHPTPEGTPA